MKDIVNIKSISNVITNSSSEVFIMNRDNAEYYHNLENTNGCISIEEITWDWIKYRGLYECNMIGEVCELDISLLESYSFYKFYDKIFRDESWRGSPDNEDWLVFIDMFHDEIEKNLIGKYWVDIEDHFENAYDVTDSARSDCEWADYRH